MTSSGTCHKCDKAAYRFHYTRPRRDAYDTHEGYWHCEAHGPRDEDTSSPEGGSKLAFAPRLSRAERRKLLRKKK